MTFENVVIGYLESTLGRANDEVKKLREQNATQAGFIVALATEIRRLESELKKTLGV